jgi:GT2 family glycosyltransferase
MRPRLSVVIPTISGREESVARCIAAYEETLFRKSHELIVIKDESSWPRACNEGYKKAQADIIHFTADDLEPLSDWWREPIRWLRYKDELPAPKVMDHSVDGKFANKEDGNNLDLTHFTRIPIMRRDQYERIGPWPEITYYADMWLSEKARTLGIKTRMFYSYLFLHHWSQIGRVDSKVNLDEAGFALNRLREEMV